MCLTSVTKTFDKPTQRERWAYKVFNLGNKGGLYAAIGDFKFRRGKWLKSKTQYNSTYEIGFHAFTKLVDAQAFATIDKAILHVRIRGVTAYGEQGDGTRAVVARELFISKIATNLNKRKG